MLDCVVQSRLKFLEFVCWRLKANFRTIETQNILSFLSGPAILHENVLCSEQYGHLGKK